MQDAGIVANTFGTGNGGNLQITATDAATLEGNSSLAARANEFWQDPIAPPGIGIITSGVGDAGNIWLRQKDPKLDLLSSNEKCCGNSRAEIWP